MAGAAPLEVAKTALEVADFAWTAVEECRHHNHLHHRHPGHDDLDTSAKEREELESLRSENRRLRNLLEEQNLKLLESYPPVLLQQRVISNTVELDSCHQLPVSEVSGEDSERAEIDSEDYVIINAEHVVEGIANFMAICVVSDPRAKGLPPQKLKEAIARAMEGESKLEKVVHIYTAGKTIHRWSRWGLALAGLYRARGVLKFAAKIAIKAL